MDIQTSSNVVTITGNIRSINDFQNIKRELDALTLNKKSVVVEIKDSISITSSVIGYLNKLVLKDNIDINLKVGHENLMSLLDDLNLATVFKAVKV